VLFTETRLKGAHLIQLEPLEDDRGFFSRTFCREEFERHGLNPCVAQCSLSYNYRKGTLRGLHYQVAPRQEAKLVRCTAGSIFDVIVDLRPASLTYCQWIGVELGSRQRRVMVYVPEGFAHGFQTLEDDTEIVYQISELYSPDDARGVRWDDPAFAIQWPEEPRVMSERDKSFPDYEVERV
jgi:dTDP-4-dehydrorhamnose 3,5-epimerase